jgi:catechol 2,3-dioxygenase-like lactoylglutathione lyase family enzyme
VGQLAPKPLYLVVFQGIIVPFREAGDGRRMVQRISLAIFQDRINLSIDKYPRELRAMKVTGFNHLSIGSKNLAESVKFYKSVLGMETIPTYNFGFKTAYLRCGDLQLHIFELEDSIPFYQHFAVDVDDFHAAYDAAKAIGALDSSAFRNPVNELPDGCVQMYLRDPAGNLLEIDWPDVRTLDRSRIPEMKLLTEFAEQDAEGLKASLYLDRPHLKPARRA